MAPKVMGMSGKDRQRYQYCCSWYKRPRSGDLFISTVGGRFRMEPGRCSFRSSEPIWRIMVFHSPVEMTVGAGKVVAVAAESLVVWRDDLGPGDYGDPRRSWSHSWISGGGPRFDALIAESGLAPLRPVVLPGPAIADRTLLGLYHELTTYAEQDAGVQESLLRLLLLEARRAAAGDAGPADPDGLLWVRRRLDRDLDRPLSLDELARERGMSARHLARRFTATWGVTPAAYHLTARMAYARCLLDQHGVPLEKIARAVGYADAFAFSKAFKRHSGMSPQDYRSPHP